VKVAAVSGGRQAQRDWGALLEIDAIVVDPVDLIDRDEVVRAVAAVRPGQLDPIIDHFIDRSDVLAAVIGDLHVFLDAKFLEHEDISVDQLEITAKKRGGEVFRSMALPRR
jgi:hypothetical protein